MGWVRYGVHMSPGLVRTIKGCWRSGDRVSGLAQPAAQGAGSATSGERGLPWQPLCSSDHLGSCCVTSSTLCAGFQGGIGMKSTVPTSCFGSPGEPETCEQLSAASWETSPQVAWQRQRHAIKPEVDFDEHFRFHRMRMDD